MPTRGSVVRSRRRVGFNGIDADTYGCFVVVSVGELNDELPTWVVVPIEDVPELYARMIDIAVPVRGAEYGGARDAVIASWGLASTPAHRFEPTPCGRLSPSTLEQLDEALRVVLGLD